MLSFFFNPIYRALAVIGAVLTAIGTIYLKGRKDALDKAKLSSLKETQDAIKKAEDARNASNLRSDRGGLLADDGYKRD